MLRTGALCDTATHATLTFPEADIDGTQSSLVKCPKKNLPPRSRHPHGFREQDRTSKMIKGSLGPIPLPPLTTWKMKRAVLTTNTASRCNSFAPSRFLFCCWRVAITHDASLRRSTARAHAPMRALQISQADMHRPHGYRGSGGGDKHPQPSVDRICHPRRDKANHTITHLVTHHHRHTSTTPGCVVVVDGSSKSHPESDS